MIFLLYVNNCSFRALYGHADNEASTGFYGSPTLSSAKRWAN